MELYKIRANKKKFCELAERLGVNRSTLWRKMKKYGIDYRRYLAR